MSFCIINDNYQEGFCDLCGMTEINQYYRIRDCFLSYNSSYLALQGLILELLGNTSLRGHDASMCADCKDKIVRFFHFKQRVREFQLNKPNPRPKGYQKKIKSIPQSEVIHDINNIINTYLATCAISSIVIDTTETKLIIEKGPSIAAEPEFTISDPVTLSAPQVASTIQNERNEDPNESDWQGEAIMDGVVIKEEPVEIQETEYSSLLDNGTSNRANQPSNYYQHLQRPSQHSSPHSLVVPHGIDSLAVLEEQEALFVDWQKNSATETVERVKSMLSYYASRICYEASRSAVTTATELVKSFFAIYFSPKLIRKFGWSIVSNRLAFNELPGHIAFITNIVQLTAPESILSSDVRFAIAEVFEQLHGNEKQRRMPTPEQYQQGLRYHMTEQSHQDVKAEGPESSQKYPRLEV